ncbi:extracellular solute-binding protein [Glutamicibacter sp. MNS18]|uniref:ABC transporter substrate-binding protein n=1 Tax=Glutamicibacter sp. MNS18 TaxID=2989817 RepID=UPI00223690F1|nr:extracellular solute-binding protein [Glutamicibacter sp. MNS18]MCW4466301.1 extracellular solute-binding protein [Glutamicibacter sp. MNS18]
MTQHRRPAGLKLAVLALPTIAALTLVGCGASSDATGGQTQEFSLTFATSNTVESPYEALAKQYMETFPDIKITLNPQPNDSYDQVVRTQLQAGNASDVLVTSPGSASGRSILPLVDAGFLEPLGESAAALVPEGSEELFGPNGEVYGLAPEITVVGLVANDTAITATNTAFPEDFAGLLAQCGPLSEEGKSLFAVAGSASPNTGLLGMQLAATRVYAQDPAWNEKRSAGEVTFADTEGWQRALEAVVLMKDAGCFQGGAEGAGFDGVTKALVSGSSLAAFIPGPSNKQLKSTAEDQDFEVRVLPSEGGPSEDFIYASANYAYSINAASRNKEAATAFLEWLAEPEQTKAFAEIDGALPVTGLEGYDFENSAYKNVAELILENRYAPLPNSEWANASVYDELGSGVQGLLTGQQTPEQVLKAMDAAWDQ